MIFDYVILVDSFKPKKNSAAVMIDELAYHMSGTDKVCVITENPEQKSFYRIEKVSENYVVLRLKTLKRLKFNVFRGISELINPYLMIAIFRIFKLNRRIQSDRFIWYSPTIFYSPFINFYKKYNKASTYLILRDLFPLWMVDLGLIRKNSFTHILLSYFEKKQYSLADSIGVQISSNIEIVKKILDHNCKVSVLNNWKIINPKQFYKKSETQLDAIYAGNIGLAQGMDNFDNIIDMSANNFSINFFSEDKYFEELKLKYSHKNNIKFSKTIPNDALELEYLNYDFGLVMLDVNHKTNNVPGKFISYISNGLPVFCIANNGNPLIDIINDNKLGLALSSKNISEVNECLIKFLKLIKTNNLRNNCISFAQSNYDVSSIANQIRESF